MRRTLFMIFILLTVILVSSCDTGINENQASYQGVFDKVDVSTHASTLPPINIEECDKLDDSDYKYGTYDKNKNVTARTKCIIRAALLKSVIVGSSEGLQICNGINDAFGKSLCYFVINNNEKSKKEVMNDIYEEQARETKNPNYCLEMDTDKLNELLCMAKVVVSTNKIDACLIDWPNSRDGDYAQFYCVFNIAINNNNVSLCKNIRSKEKIGDCYNDFAYKSYKLQEYDESAEYCEMILSNDEQREACLDRALARTKYWQSKR